jgi:plasmid maintenance system killer protein
MRACSEQREGQRRWGPDRFRLLQRRLASLAAAETLEDMSGVPGKCHQLHADRAGEVAVSLWGSYRLVFEADHDPLPLLPDRGIDRNLVTKIRIKEVVDYHGD